MNNPRTPRSSTSTPARTPSIVDRFEEELRKNVFALGRDITRQAVESGLWYDFDNGDVDSPEILQWPLDRNGARILPEEFSEAFSSYHIAEAHCLCATQETTPTGRRKHTLWIRVSSTYGENYGRVVAGCRSMGKGCGLFIRLDELYQHPDLPCVEYPRRLTRGPGIPRFNWHGVEIVPTDIYQPPNNPIPPALPAPQFPPPTSLSPYSPPVNRFPMVSGSHRLDDSSTISSSGSGRRRPRSESQSHVVAPPSKMPRLKGKGRATRQTYVVSDSNDEAIPPSPTPAPRQHVRKKHESPPSYATSVSVTSGRQAGSSRAVVDSQSPPRYLTRLPYEPSERFFGDCMGLEEPLDTPMLAVRNSDIPPLTQEETSFYLESLQQPEGVRHWIFWQLVDRCNCG
ncbi:hypothetical protein M422DRAFT_252047 [Sphaerobolus stellatus SS14]|uniref:Uncharacterized protein n=1 Tax=Sphaerobolus stellatus (strain SS14) TaxID=990650 RepID=A0A0C9UN98_SPHS4|nr:hypothetical protein M422DRAFT_252047 [Sphaerobolus stellatus SS14]